MKLLRKANRIFTLMLVGYLSFSIVPATQGFNGSFASQKFIEPGPGGQERRQFNILMSKIDAEQWTIGLRYSVDCPAEFRQKEAELKEMIVESLRAWLKPIRDLKPGLPITDVFRFVRHKDFSGNMDDDSTASRLAERQAVDVSITFEFRGGFSVAVLGLVNPEVYIRDANQINTNKRALFATIMHEFGHCFGLGDTYVNPHPTRQSTGGWERTVGMQPTSRMAANGLGDPPGYPCEDDVRGIQWIYKNIYEGVASDDCFFADYVFEEETETKGCRPKYPFIFEIKHLCQASRFVTDMLFEDQTINVNERDDEGMTALHYAVMREDAVIVKDLLDLENIKPFLRDKRGRTALRLAQEAELDDIAALLRRHPLTSRIDLTQTVATTWGNLKIEQ